MPSGRGECQGTHCEGARLKGYLHRAVLALGVVSGSKVKVDPEATLVSGRRQASPGMTALPLQDTS